MLHKKLLILTVITVFLGSISISFAQNNTRAGQMSSVQAGVITSMQEVTSEGKAGLGSKVVGGAAGGVLGNQVGGGSGKKVATVAGALVGARVGAKRSQARDTQNNVEFIIKLDNGQTVSVVQSSEGSAGFKAGDKVNVISSPDGTARVARG